jgi:GNAT superfamily N-acetyltransferase
MWPHMDISFVILENDNEGHHYGLFVNDQLVSVCSLFIAKGEAQFRKFATELTWQGKGYGSILINHVVQKAADFGAEVLWCNARKDKATFYERMGMTPTAETFLKEGVEYIRMELKLPNLKS